MPIQEEVLRRFFGDFIGKISIVILLGSGGFGLLLLPMDMQEWIAVTGVGGVSLIVAVSRYNALERQYNNEIEPLHDDIREIIDAAREDVVENLDRLQSGMGREEELLGDRPWDVRGVDLKHVLDLGELDAEYAEHLENHHQELVQALQRQPDLSNFLEEKLRAARGHELQGLAGSAEPSIINERYHSTDVYSRQRMVNHLSNLILYRFVPDTEVIQDQLEIEEHEADRMRQKAQAAINREAGIFERLQPLPPNYAEYLDAVEIVKRYYDDLDEMLQQTLSELR